MQVKDEEGVDDDDDDDDDDDAVVRVDEGVVGMAFAVEVRDVEEAGMV